MSQKQVDKLRIEIDKVDQELLRLFNRRAELVVDLGRVKQADGKKLLDAEREQTILARLVKNNPGPLSSEAIVHLYESLIDESRRHEYDQVYEKKNKEK